MSEPIKNKWRHQFFKKAELCRRLKITRPLLDRLLKRTGAPSPKLGTLTYDARVIYDWVCKYSELEVVPDGKTFHNWNRIEPNAGKGAEPDEGNTNTWAYEKRMKTRIERLQKERDYEISQRQYIHVSEYEKVLVPLMAELQILLRQKFLYELPAQYLGRDAIDCYALNEKALDQVIQRFREGSLSLKPTT